MRALGRSAISWSAVSWSAILRALIWRTVPWLAIALLSAAVTPPTRGQEPRQEPAAPEAPPDNGRRGPFGFMPFGGGLATLAGVPEIQKELEVSDEQQELLEKLLADLGDQRRAMFRRGPPGDERTAGEMRKRFEKQVERGDELLSLLLEPPQVQRLEELRLQREGARALDRDPIAKQLELTEEQRAKVRELRERRDGALDREAPALLTEEQLTRWEKMKGKPFEFPRSMPRFGRRNQRPR